MTDESRNRGSSDDGVPSYRGDAGSGPAAGGPSDDTPTLPNIFGGRRPDDDPDTIVDNLTARITGSAVPPRPAAWSQTGSTPPPTRSMPAAGWAAGPPPAAPAAPQQIGAPGPDPERRRRRRAVLAVLGVIGATVAVVGTAILVAPQFSSSPQPDRTPDTASSVASTAPATRSSLPPATTATQPPPSSAPAPAPVTVTRTVTPTSRATAGPATTPAGTKPAGTAPTTAKPKPTTAKPKPTTPKPKPAPAPDTSLGVPRQDISCSNGYLVQLASELTPEAFRARVAALRSAGQVPADARAADSRSSCAIFSGQRNTWVLYAGPFGSPYDGCAQRLSGPADSFIKGANPNTSREFVSCVCGAGIRGVPRIGPGSDQRGWIGELQRMLAGRLNISVGELGADQWGVYTDGTKAAVTRFQQQNRLPASGSVDLKTWRAIISAGC